jgi:surfeit locus 1 family protein
VVRFRNTHLIYALTWFGLAGLSVFGLVLIWRRSARRP